MFDPRRKPHRVGDVAISFPALHKEFRWPDSVSGALLNCPDPESLPDPLLALLRAQGVIGSTPVEPVQAPGFFVFDELSSQSLAHLPKDGPFLYAGDPQGGFYAAATAQGTVPCPSCLMRRYLSGRRATPALYQALRDGCTVRFESQVPSAFEPESGVRIFGNQTAQLEEILPVPDCRDCWERAPEYSQKALEQSVFSPIVKRWKTKHTHTVRLPQMLWLTGAETVGSGSAWHEDPEVAKLKATHEALERYSAHFAPPEMHYTNTQGKRNTFPDFPSLLSQAGSVSTGLACRFELDNAVEDGTREICERDALAKFWLAADAGQPSAQVLAIDHYGELEVTTLLLDSFHHPTVVAQGRSREGRLVFGSACHDLETAAQKATQECRQNFQTLSELETPRLIETPSSFYEHALYYWWKPESFPQLIPLEDPRVKPLPEPPWWIELTPPDLACLGYKAVRVHLPGLLHTPMSHQSWARVLGGRFDPPKQPHPFA